MSGWAWAALCCLACQAAFTAPAVSPAPEGWLMAPAWQNPPPSTEERPPTDQPGWDFWTFWLTGRAAEPYTVAGAIYPPPMMLLLRVLGLLPGQVAFYVWTGLNLLLLVLMFKRRVLLYIFYMPVMFHLGAGQLDIFFLWLSTFLKKGDWKAILAGALITLKPQVALILLPWHLLRWARKPQIIWSVVTASLWGHYYLVRPTWYAQWLSSASGTVQDEISATPSLFSLFPFWLSIPLAAALLSYAWFRLDEESALAAGVFAMPFGKTYDAVLLLRSRIVWWIVPLSWAGLFLSLSLNHPWPQAVVTALVLALALHRFFQKTGEPNQVGQRME